MSDTVYTERMILHGGPIDVFADTAASSVMGQRVPLMRTDGVPLYAEVIDANVTADGKGLNVLLACTEPFTVPPGTPPATHGIHADGTAWCGRPGRDRDGTPLPASDAPTCPTCLHRRQTLNEETPNATP